MRSAERRRWLCLSMLALAAQSAEAQGTLLDSIVVRDVRPGPATTVVIRATDASIHVVGAGSGSVVARLSAGAGRSGPGALLSETRGRSVLVSVQRRPRGTSRLDVAVPRGVAVRIEGDNGGAVSVEGVGGPVEITHSNGAVTVTGVVGYALIATSNGGIVAQIDSLAPGASSSLITSNGDVVLTLPRDGRATLSIDAGLEVESELPLSTDRGASRQAGSRFVVSQLGGGGSPVRVSTDNGIVQIRGRRE